MALVRRERDAVSAEWASNLEAAAARRLSGEPVSRIIGEREFWGLKFTLNEATLDPRPETELLVAEAIALGEKHRSARILDLGTGSGAIALAILSALPKAKATATDSSEAALDMARRNAGRHGLAPRIEFRLGSWWQAVPHTEMFDLIASNPPYIASDVIPTLAPEVRLFDPAAALDGGWDGLEGYRAIASQAARRLVPDGLLLLEIGFNQADIVVKMLSRAGFGRVTVQKDLAGLDRMVLASHS